MAKGKCALSENWLDDSSYQSILRETHMVAFEYDAVTREQRVSPHIQEFIAGNYDGRLLSDVMLEDNVIHPEDIEKSLVFREQVKEGLFGEMTLRLKTPQGIYQWFRMVMTNKKYGESSHVYVGVLADVDVHMQYQEILRHRAEIDPVSGLYNRETFLERTEKLLNKESDQEHFLISFDIDRFKLINKLFGNDEGDKVLRFVGDVLRGLSRPGEIFGRHSGDVFAACVGRSREETVAMVQEIEHKMRNYPLAFRFFLPTGIAPVAPGCHHPVSELCDRAVIARHKIKGNYLCPFLFYESSMSVAMDREHELIVSMEKALEERQFVAYYQPKFDMRNGRVIGAEALARWKHPSLGIVSPADFIPLFEKNGFIIKLDEYIWELACRTIRYWLDSGITPVPISVNVSRMHLYNKNFCQRVIELCDQYKIPHHLLELEITESAFTESPQELFPVMEVLQRAGFLFSMDDFGSGYSSLNMLKDIPINIVKFDLNFLKEARNGKQAGESILKNIIRLMKDLEVTILAEGVETKNQVEFLREVGCFYVQGYFYARPMQVPDMETLLRQEDAFLSKSRNIAGNDSDSG